MVETVVYFLLAAIAAYATMRIFHIAGSPAA
jgi:hypothetical protein